MRIVNVTGVVPLPINSIVNIIGTDIHYEVTQNGLRPIEVPVGKYAIVIEVYTLNLKTYNTQ